MGQTTYTYSIIKTDNIREGKGLMMVAKNYLALNECFYVRHLSIQQTKKIISNQQKQSLKQKQSGSGPGSSSLCIAASPAYCIVVVRGSFLCI